MHPAKAAGDAERAAKAEEHVAAGYALRKRGDFAAAVAGYGAALGIEPRHFKALFNRGFCLDKVTPIALRRVGKECCGSHGLLRTANPSIHRELKRRESPMAML